MTTPDTQADPRIMEQSVNTITTTRTSIDGQVNSVDINSLVGTGNWDGVAAQTFRTAIQQWHANADEILAALQNLADRVNQSKENYQNSINTTTAEAEQVHATMRSGGLGI